jgi:hypothetical protein
MYVQVIKGRTKDPQALMEYGRSWQTKVRPGAIGYVGSTAGVSPDGTFVVLAQFTDDVSAKENSSRPEQDAWFQGFAKLIDGEPTFAESTDTSLLFDGPSTKAGFVQIMESRVTDRAKAEAFENDELLDQLRKARPDLLGGLRVWLPNDRVIEAAYFTSEADARKGEQSEDFGDQGAQFGELYADMTYIDLPNPEVNQA